MTALLHQDISIAADTDIEIVLPISLSKIHLLKSVQLNISTAVTAVTAVLYLGTAAGFTIRSKEQFYESDSIDLSAVPLNNDDIGDAVAAYFDVTGGEIYARLVLNAAGTVTAHLSFFATSHTDGV